MAGLLTTAQVANITAIIAKSLDQSLPLYRNSGQGTSDANAHTQETYPSTPTSTIACNVYKPSGTKLQQFAGIIGTQEAMFMRYLSTSDVREGDRIVYSGENWVVQNVLNAESYSFCNDALITIVS